MISAVAGCGFGDIPLDEVDPEAIPVRPTWSAQIEPIMARYCTACHAASAQPGTISGLDLERCLDVRRREKKVLSTVLDSETMPPGGADRLTSAEALALERWYEQGAICD